MANVDQKIKTTRAVRDDMYRKDRGNKHDRKLRRQCKREAGDTVEEQVFEPLNTAYRGSY